MRRRTLLKKRYVSVKTPASRDSILNKLADIEKKLQKSHQHNRQLTEKRAVDKISKNPKFFYAFAKKFSKVRVGVGPLINRAKQLISAPRKMAEILSEQFSSVFSTPRYVNTTAEDFFPHSDVLNAQSLTNIIFSDKELREAMEDLAPNAAPGPDGFPAIL